MKRLILASVLTTLAAIPQASYAHFIWLVPKSADGQQASIQVCFGEDAFDSGSEFLDRLNGMSLHSVSGKDAATAIQLVRTDSSLSAAADAGSDAVYVASHDLGVINRGDTVFRLKYYAKTGPAISSSAWSLAVCTDDLKLDIVPTVSDSTVTINVCFDGKPAAGAQIKVARPGMDDFEGETNADGQVSFEVQEDAIHSIRARYIEQAEGELDGKKYGETRHYCTVAALVRGSESSVAATNLQSLPQPVTSFGAAVMNGSLYMYGGHTGGAHSYSKEEQSNHLTRLDLNSGQWETLIEGPHLQGLALVAHKDKLYRIGGFTAENAEGEDHNLWSQNSVACFDPKRNEWTEMPSLPERRSSHDAAVVGDCIYVVGGWAMRGDADRVWHTTAWKMDLNAEPLHWQPIAAPPFQRRALAAAAHEGKLVAVGGMQNEGGPTTRVAIYDPAADEWSEGPALLVNEVAKSDDSDDEPGRMSSGAMTGFGASAFATGGRLYVTTVQGDLQRLSADGSKWEVAGATATPRFFHRLLPIDDRHLLIVGGANMSIGKFEEVEVLNVDQGT